MTADQFAQGLSGTHLEGFRKVAPNDGEGVHFAPLADAPASADHVFGFVVAAESEASVDALATIRVRYFNGFTGDLVMRAGQGLSAVTITGILNSGTTLNGLAVLAWDFQQP